MARRASEHSDEPLVIDRAAAAEIPSSDAVREWGHGKRAFISSVMAELPQERQAAAAAVRTVSAAPVMFELFGGRDGDPEDAYLGEVEASDIYIGILGRRYGKPLPTRYSATHAEYLHAERSGFALHRGACVQAIVKAMSNPSWTRSERSMSCLNSPHPMIFARKPRIA